MGTIAGPPLEIEAPAPRPYPYGLFSHIHWLDRSAAIGEQRGGRVEGTASDPAPTVDGGNPVGEGTNVAGGWNRWEGGSIQFRPLPLVETPPLSDHEDPDSDPLFTATRLQVQDGTEDLPFDGEKVRWRAPGYREFDTAFQLIYRQEISASEGIDEAKARAEVAYDLIVQTAVEQQVYAALLASDRLEDITGTVGTIANSLSKISAAWTDAGLPVLLLPHLMWPFLDTERHLVDGTGPGGAPAKFTSAGHRLVLAKGFDDILVGGADPDPGEIPLYAVGELFGFRSNGRARFVEHDTTGDQNDAAVMIEETFFVGWNSYRELTIVASSEQVVV